MRSLILLVAGVNSRRQHSNRLCRLLPFTKIKDTAPDYRPIAV